MLVSSKAPSSNHFNIDISMSEKATKGSPIEILLVEDHFPDVVLTKKAFERGKYPFKIHVAKDGEEALNKLTGNHSAKVRPDIILLDINLPKISGYEVLEKIKQDENLCTIPVIMLTSSSEEKDVLRSYKLHANSYLVKPSTLRKFVEIVNHIEGFWFSIAKLDK